MDTLSGQLSHFLLDTKRPPKGLGYSCYFRFWKLWFVTWISLEAEEPCSLLSWECHPGCSIAALQRGWAKERCQNCGDMAGCCLVTGATPKRVIMIIRCIFSCSQTCTSVTRRLPEQSRWLVADLSLEMQHPSKQREYGLWFKIEAFFFLRQNYCSVVLELCNPGWPWS